MSNDTAHDAVTAARSGFRAAQRASLPMWLAAGAPVVPARREGATLVITCPFCSQQHKHGCCLHRGPCLPGDGICFCPAGSGDGHRIEHCRTRPRGLLPGYILREAAA
jgi:hypothetical protein